MAELDVKIKDGKGGKSFVKVTKYNAVNTHLIPPELPKTGQPPRRRPHINKVDLHNGGAGHDGSVTPVTIDLVEGDPTDMFNYYIQNIVIVIVAASVPFNRFGSINGGITNGISLFADVQGNIDYLAQDIKTNGEILIYAGGGDLMPTNPATVNSFAGTNDAIVATFDLNELIPEAGVSGIEIARGSFDKISFTISDDLTTGVADLFAIVKGYRLYE